MIRTQTELLAAKSSGLLCPVCTIEFASMCRRVGCADHRELAYDPSRTRRQTPGASPTLAPPRRPAGPGPLPRAVRVGLRGAARALYWPVFIALGGLATALITLALSAGYRG